MNAGEKSPSLNLHQLDAFESFFVMVLQQKATISEIIVD